MRIPRFLTLLSAALFALCSAGFATSFNFAAFGTGDICHTDTFLAGAISMQAWGFTGNASSPNTDLWYKADGGDETGLGLSNDTVDHEVQGTSFLQFTAANVATISIGSVQSGETYQLYGSNTLGTLGTKIGSLGTADVTNLNLAAIDGTWTYVSLFAPTGNVLLDSATASAPVVPEPGTSTMLMTLGVVGLLAFGRRKLFA
jgi:hypothetical protein